MKKDWPFICLKWGRSRGLMVSGGIYWKSGKLHPGYVNPGAVRAAGQGLRTKEGTARMKRGSAEPPAERRDNAVRSLLCQGSGLSYAVSLKHSATATQTLPVKSSTGRIGKSRQLCHVGWV